MNPKNIDIFQLLFEDAEKRRKKKTELLKTLGIREYFKEGNVRIDIKICQGIECRLCIKACPTNALYWSQGQVNVTEDLCIYCAACVLSCIVDGCIKITRKRIDGRIESFSTPREAIRLLQSISSRRRIDLVSRVLKH